MNTLVLTDRQQAEREFYDEHARRHAPEAIGFDPVLGHERRPWNSYWVVYELARGYYRNGARRVLDFGCGKGTVGIRLARIGYDVCGFDISPGNIEVARRLAVQYGLERRTRFSVQAAEHLTYDDDGFDLVIGMDILHHVDVPAAVVQALRVLKPGGHAIFREHIEVPFQEKLRNSRIGQWLVPTGESLDRNITRHERKLNRDDLAAIRRICPDMHIRRFTLLSRLDVFIRNKRGHRPSRLERLDHLLIRSLPFLGAFGATGVIVLHKPAAG